MGMKTKKFDCVQMKNRVQRELMQEYRASRAQFTSYVDFLNATADESEEIRAFRDKVAKAKTVAES
jgi:capsule polysaccharide export protein KpsC/LpsZ